MIVDEVQNSRLEVLLSEKDESDSKDLMRKIKSTNAEGSSEVLIRHSGKDIRLPPELSRLLLGVIKSISNNESVSINSMPKELTTTQAARLLDISRPTLLRRIQAGEVESFKVGTHTRIKTSEVMKLRRTIIQQRREALDDLLALEDF